MSRTEGSSARGARSCGERLLAGLAGAREGDYTSVMPNRDLLVVAGMASETLERHGLVACGRRENGVARVDFWTRNGKAYRHELKDEALTVDEVVAACLSIAGISAEPARPISPLN